MLPIHTVLTVAVDLFKRDRSAGAYFPRKKFYNLPKDVQEHYRKEAAQYLPAIRSHSSFKPDKANIRAS